MDFKVEKLSIADLKAALDLVQKEIINLNHKKIKEPSIDKELNRYKLTRSLIVNEIGYRLKKLSD